MDGGRLLAVVAHPDDETFGCGSTLLYAAARGVTTYVCCTTRGEAGEPAPGSGVTVDELPRVREAELRAAADVMGVCEVVLLNHRDSGMQGAPAEGAFVSATIEGVAREVAEVIDRLRPHVVLTLDASDRHRDHVHVRDATLAAVDVATWDVGAVYLQCLPRSTMRRWADLMREQDPDSPYLDVDAAELGTPDEDITTVIDTGAFYDQRWSAIRCHASQTSPYDGLPDDLARAFLERDHLRRVRPAWPHEARESELSVAVDRAVGRTDGE